MSDLSPLAGTPLLVLNFAGTSISDLSPLEDVPLVTFHGNRTLVSDFSPLSGLRLETMTWSDPLFDPTQEQIVRGLPLVFSGMNQRTPVPVKEFWGDMERRRAEAEAFASVTSKLPADKQAREVELRLKAQPGGHAINFRPVIRDGKIVEVALVRLGTAEDITALRAPTHLNTLVITAGPDWLDLSPLRGLPLEVLNCTERQRFRNAGLWRDLPKLKSINGESVRRDVEGRVIR